MGTHGIGSKKPIIALSSETHVLMMSPTPMIHIVAMATLVQSGVSFLHQPSCPAHYWTLNKADNRCYITSVTLSERRSDFPLVAPPETAWSICQFLGSEIVEPLSPQLNQFIYNLSCPTAR